MQSNIKHIKLSEVADVIDSLHQTPKYCNKGIPMVRVTDVRAGDLDLTNCLMVSAEDYEKYSVKHKPQIGDIIISRVGSYGIFSYVASSKAFCLGQNTAIISPKINSRYLYYVLSSFFVRQQIEQMVVGSTQKTISLKNIKDLQIPLFDEKEQDKIAQILESIDKKIAVNKQINDNLQKLFVMQYAHTFVENRDPLWSTIPLSDVFFFQEGPGIRNWQYVTQDGTKFINIRCIADGDINTATANMISSDEACGKYAHFMLEPYDIVMSCSGTLGRYAIVRPHHLPLCLNTSVIRFRPRRGFEDFAFLYGYLTSSEFLNKQRELACGSVQANFGPTHLKKMEIVVAPEEVRDAFHQLTFPLISQMIHLRDENNKLAEIRDALLPKLMSGEIDVTNLVI